MYYVLSYYVDGPFDRPFVRLIYTCIPLYYCTMVILFLHARHPGHPWPSPRSLRSLPTHPLSTHWLQRYKGSVHLHRQRPLAAAANRPVRFPSLITRLSK
ncbi:hypothetical protein K504DRAFT_178323 [Pleomassaria siparia CBS 279.74]|uniref:Uncharacterized protein n=1 Tax=Pleomassaria siparia CBS 279.74 TaxID=1314801 RepID=A0A6G1JT01_9PLEO|nr:hypothetical protein K504DRAFT_178323 [Pleomassaria siparia CBS 279.74]